MVPAGGLQAGESPPAVQDEISPATQHPCGQGSAVALVRVVLSWDVALVWVGVGKGGGGRRLWKSRCGRPGAQSSALAERGPPRGPGGGVRAHA